MSSLKPAERIRARIEAARTLAAAAGRDLDLHAVYLHALMGCGLGRAEAAALLAQARDPILHLLHYAGDSHNLALLLVEDALAEAA